MRNIKVILIIFCLWLTQGLVYAQNPSDYLILQDIGSYIHRVQTKDFKTLQLKSIPGYKITNNSGVLMGSGHFLIDHNDKSYETDYESDATDLAVDVQVTQHTGGDSDRWLLHEIENSYRSMKMEKMGLPYGASVTMRDVNGNKIIYGGLGGAQYTWLNNNIVISIEYTDLQRTKPEPLEIVQAYLTKFPSTITTTAAEFKSNAYNIKWIKDEIDRRFWLCDKWNAQFQAGKTTQKDLLYRLVKSMEEFLNYRQAYFGMTATDEISALYEMQTNKDATSIQTKLTEYKTWWAKNKGKDITLPQAVK